MALRWDRRRQATALYRASRIGFEWRALRVMRLRSVFAVRDFA
jgi:hypothetical protein